MRIFIGNFQLFFHVERFLTIFLSVVVQNERYDDWTSTIQFMRKLFPIYQQQVLEYHSRPGVVIPKAYNSTASQGNFLEVLNMSLNGELDTKFHLSFFTTIYYLSV